MWELVVKKKLLAIIEKFRKFGLEYFWGMQDRTNFLIHLTNIQRELEASEETNEAELKKQFDIFLVGSIIMLMMSWDKHHSLHPTNYHRFLYPKSYEEFSTEFGVKEMGAVPQAKALGTHALIHKTLPFIGTVPIALFPRLASPFPLDYFTPYNLNTNDYTMDTKAISDNCYQAKQFNTLYRQIEIMSEYGETLKAEGASKGQVAIDLATELDAMAKKFFAQSPEQRDFTKFESNFSELLHSKDEEMSAYRFALGTIIANIAIALTGIGLLLMAGKLVYSKVTEGRALFFFQKSTTTSEDLIATVHQQMASCSRNLCA